MLIEIIIDLFGSASELARRIGVKPQAVEKWRRGKMPISALSAIKIEQATNGAVTRAEIRPDIFGEV